MVISISSEKELNNLLDKASIEMKLVVIDFFTSWCAPCQLFAPEFERLSLTYFEDSYFVKVDCDNVMELALKYNISKLPTLKGLIYTDNVFTIEGAINLDDLINKIEDQIILPCLKSLYNKNPPIIAQNYLLKLSSNIVNNPQEEKFRQLKLSNKAVKENLLQYPGVVDCLLSIGFKKEETRFYMPIDSSFDNLKKFTKQLTMILKKSSDNTNGSQINNANVKKSVQGSAKVSQKILSNSQCTMAEKGFLQKIHSIRTNIKLYENDDLMNIVNVLVDIESYKLPSLSEETTLKKVLRWFKYDFFSWFNSPTCTICSRTYESIGSTSPTPEESHWLASTVELYKCPTCSAIFRFPRYNHPEKLLISRTGRCGEWANCFSMIIRSFIKEGLFEKARFIMDWSDHVWCEIYMKLDGESEKGWVHVDPCECVFNTPLVYEVGWKKQINYVIGVTLITGDVQDVTWRYTQDFKATLLRRKLIREDILIENLINFHKEAKTNIKEITAELVLFLSPRTEKKGISENETIGRTTGSVEWRTQRGELGQQPLWMKKFTGQSITPTALELDNNCIHIQYNCSTDQYFRPCDNERKNPISADGEMSPSSSCSSQRKSSTNKSRTDLLSHDSENWQALAASWKNIKRKVEYDWQIVYLARIADTPADASGEISWTIDLTGTNKVIGEISIFASSAEFHNATVKWRLHSEQCQVPVNGFVTTSDFNNCTSVTLTALLESCPNSTDSNSWQHTQLCRQKSTDFEVKTLQIKVELHDDL